MRIPKAKSREASMKSRVEVRSMVALSHKRAPDVSASVVTDRFCDEMIQNLRHNVSESKKRSRHAVLA